MAVPLPRRVEPELLDGMAAEDPRAQRSRTDLRRVHRAMGTLSIVLRALDEGVAGNHPRSVLELGAGDGALMLRLAQARASRWPGVDVTLLDRLDLVTPATQHSLGEQGWTPRVVVADVFDALQSHATQRWDIVLANLFLHHFPAGELSRLLALVAARSRVFLCCEPRRAALPLAGSRLIGLLGVGPVTRQDAVSSVHAGFRAHELTDLWPDRKGWDLSEHAVGLFSHCFLAVRKEH
jgi:Methyltransferase domain